MIISKIKNKCGSCDGRKLKWAESILSPNRRIKGSRCQKCGSFIEEYFYKNKYQKTITRG